MVDLTEFLTCLSRTFDGFVRTIFHYFSQLMDVVHSMMSVHSAAAATKPSGIFDKACICPSHGV